MEQIKLNPFQTSTSQLNKLTMLFTGQQLYRRPLVSKPAAVHHKSTGQTLAWRSVRLYNRHICRASVTQEQEYVARIQVCKDGKNWQDLIELLAEARVLKLELPPNAYEAAICTFCDGGQAERAAKILRQVNENNIPVDNDTITLVFTSLSRARAGKTALELYSLYKDGSAPYFGTVYNAVTRACARGGLLDEALMMLNDIVMSSETIPREESTFSVVAAELINNGRQEDGLEVLEMRDYL